MIEAYQCTVTTVGVVELEPYGTIHRIASAPCAKGVGMDSEARFQILRHNQR